MAALADVAPHGADLIGPAFLPRLRRGLHDFARFAGFSTANSFKLALMGTRPAPTRGWPYPLRPAGSRYLLAPPPAWCRVGKSGTVASPSPGEKVARDGRSRPPSPARMRGLFPRGLPRTKNIRSSSSTRPPIDEAGESRGHCEGAKNGKRDTGLSL